MRHTISQLLSAAVLLLPTAVSAQGSRPAEYTPSPVAGSAWNAPGNANPFIPGYFADPTIRRFGDTYYLYATTDGTGNGYGPAQVWMSYDFVNWRNVVMNWPTTEVVWAPDVVSQPDGTYRYYYCEPCNVNVGSSTSPTGPWRNLLGKDDAVLVPDRYVHNVITLDPQLFRDDDGQEYLYFTTWGIYKGFGCGVARVNPQFTAANPSLGDARLWREDAPFPIVADEFFAEKRLIPNTELKDIFEAPFVFKRNGVYYFTYSSGSCHTDTYRVQYATSTVGPMGPFEYQGEVLTTNADATVHGPGHHSILCQDGRYYIVYHRHNLPRSVHGFNRQVCVDELTFTADGRIVPVVPTHNAMGVDLSQLRTRQAGKSSANLAYGARVTASSYYDEWFRPEYAVDDNNATLWKARFTNWDGRQSQSHHDEWLQIDLGKPQKFSEVWTQFEYATFFYQYKIETSLDGESWTLYADRTANTMQGSPMIDRGSAKARYVRLTITDTQKNGHLPAVWNVKVWKRAPRLPGADATGSSAATAADGDAAYPGMHRQDVSPAAHDTVTAFVAIAADDLARRSADATQPFDVSELAVDYSGQTGLRFKANKPLRARVKDGRWALFFNGTQRLESDRPLPAAYRYNAPYTIGAWVLSTKVGAVSTLVSLSASRADLATTEFRLGTDPQSGLVNHNGSFESYGSPDAVKAAEGQWHFWVLTFDGWQERVYCDGRLIHEQNNFIMVRPEGHITIGADAAGTNSFMGYLSTLFVVPRSVTAGEIGQMYEASRRQDTPSLGDDFEETDPDSKFTLPADMKPVYEEAGVFRLSATTADFNAAPLQNGARLCRELTGDFVAMATIDDMEGLAAHDVKGFNEGGLIVADGQGTYYQLGAFPLYNCGNMLTVLSPAGRPQYPNYKGYDFDRYLQIERRGALLFARTSPDGQTWTNMPGSPIEVTAPTLGVGVYQTTYSETPSWVALRALTVYQR